MNKTEEKHLYCSSLRDKFILYTKTILYIAWFFSNTNGLRVIYNLIHELFQYSRMLLSKQFYHHAKHGRVDLMTFMIFKLAKAD